MSLPRPRRRAGALVTGSLLLFAVGTNVQAGWLFVLASVLLAVALAGWLLPSRLIRGIRVRRSAPARAFQGDDVAVEVTVRADARRPSLSLLIRDQYLGPATLFVPHLAAGEEAVVTTKRRAARRGLVEGVPIQVSSNGPFGVAEARRSHPADGATLVYPRVVALQRFPGVHGRDERGLAGGSTHRRGMGQDYLGIREYRAGDSPRHVHWPSSARHGSLMVRDFEQERPDRLAILIDTSAEGNDREGPLDAACAVAASVALLALERGQPVDLCAGRDRGLDLLVRPSPPGALEWLARLGAGGGLPLAEAAARAAAALGSDRTAVIVLPTWRWNGAEAAQAFLGPLRSSGRDPVAVVVDAGSFEGEVSDHGAKREANIQSEDEVGSLIRALSGRCEAVFHVAGDRDLVESLRQPVGGRR
jgi:hypothetical protein